MPKTKRRNRNEVPLTKNDVVRTSVLYDDLFYKKNFKFLCKLRPNKKTENIDIVEDVREKNFNIDKKGLVYAFVLGGKLLKIGSTTTEFTGRVSSYNCGKEKNRESGTCSTTNYFVLQSFLKLNQDIEVYAFFSPVIKYLIFDTNKKFPLPPKEWEKTILEKMKAKNKMPILCTQR